jgi:hypothetical protein
VRTINRSAALVEPLSDRELDVLRLLGTDLDGPDVARAFPSLNTMRTRAPRVRGLPVGAENCVTSCELQVFVDEAAEPVPSEHADGRPGTCWGVGCGRVLVQGSVRSVRVEVLHILAQDVVEVAWSGDQRWSRHSRRRVPMKRSAIAFARGARTGVRMMRRSAPVNTASKAAVNLLSRSRIKNRLLGAVAELHQQVAGLLSYPVPGRVGGNPGQVHAATVVLDHDQDVEAAQEHGVDVREVDCEDRTGLRGRTGARSARTVGGRDPVQRPSGSNGQAS